MSVPNTPPPSLNPYITELPEARLTRYSRLTTGYWLLDKISLVAIGAILAAIFAITYTGAALAGASSLAAVVGIISTYPLMLLASRSNKLWREYQGEAQLEKEVIAQLKFDERLSDNEIAQFLRREGVDVDLIGIAPRRLLPLIARYKVISREAERVQDQAHQQMVDQNSDRSIRLSLREQGLELLENKGVPMAIGAAVLLQIMQQPTLQLQIAHPTPLFAYSHLGLCRPKKPLERILDRKLEPRDDKYFFFVQSLHRPPLTLDELCRNLAPRVIRLKLFG